MAVTALLGLRGRESKGGGGGPGRELGIRKDPGGRVASQGRPGQAGRKEVALRVRARGDDAPSRPSGAVETMTRTGPAQCWASQLAAR